jgi:hypothetical protein
MTRDSMTRDEFAAEIAGRFPSFIQCPTLCERWLPYELVSWRAAVVGHYFLPNGKRRICPDPSFTGDKHHYYAARAAKECAYNTLRASYAALLGRALTNVA